jgi:hypothetical protein
MIITILLKLALVTIEILNLVSLMHSGVFKLRYILTKAKKLNVT